MEPARVYFFRVGGEMRGPAGVEQLRDLGSVGVIGPATEIAPAAAGPWAPLASLPVCAEVFPPRPAINFKSTEFEELNRGSSPAMDPFEVQAQANHPPISLRGREVVVPPQVRLARDGDPANDVQAMVREVGRQIAAHEPPLVLPPPPSPFPRWKWFALPAVLGTAGIFSIPWFYGRPYELFTVTILGGWAVMFNGLLLLIMVLDRQHSDTVRRNAAKCEKLG